MCSSDLSGLYFISKENEQSIMTPYPALFNWTDDPYVISYVHPVPENSLLRLGAAGFGLLLMHRSVVKAMKEKHGNDYPFFNETGTGKQFVSEDINFFRLMGEAGVPLHANTAAHVKHMKRFAFDMEDRLLADSSHERDSVIEECARVVDQCNREGPYNAIGAASRIRSLKSAIAPTDKEKS